MINNKYKIVLEWKSRQISYVIVNAKNREEAMRKAKRELISKVISKLQYKIDWSEE